MYALGFVVGDEEGEGADGLLVDEKKCGGGKVKLRVPVMERGWEGGMEGGKAKMMLCDNRGTKWLDI